MSISKKFSDGVFPLKAHYLRGKKNTCNIAAFLKGNFFLITNMDIKIGSYGTFSKNGPKKRPRIAIFGPIGLKNHTSSWTRDFKF